MPFIGVVDQYLTVLPDCPSRRTPSFRYSSHALYLGKGRSLRWSTKNNSTLDNLRHGSVADALIYAIVLAAVAAAAITGAIWHWGYPGGIM